MERSSDITSDFGTSIKLDGDGSDYARQQMAKTFELRALGPVFEEPEFEAVPNSPTLKKAQRAYNTELLQSPENLTAEEAIELLRETGGCHAVPEPFSGPEPGRSENPKARQKRLARASYICTEVCPVRNLCEKALQATQLYYATPNEIWAGKTAEEWRRNPRPLDDRTRPRRTRS